MVIENGKFECFNRRKSFSKSQWSLNVSVQAVESRRRQKRSKANPKQTRQPWMEPHNLKSIIPARACNELVKLLDGSKALLLEVRLALVAGQIVWRRHSLSVNEIDQWRLSALPRTLPSQFHLSSNFLENDVCDRTCYRLSDDRTHLIKMH